MSNQVYTKLSGVKKGLLFEPFNRSTECRLRVPSLTVAKHSVEYCLSDEIKQVKIYERKRRTREVKRDKRKRKRSLYI